MSWIRTVSGAVSDTLFGCNHAHLTRPFTLQAHSYKVCLDCGRQLPYSIEKMRLLRAWEEEGSEPQFAELKVVPAASRFSRKHTLVEVDHPDDSRAIA